MATTTRGESIRQSNEHNWQEEMDALHEKTQALNLYEFWSVGKSGEHEAVRDLARFDKAVPHIWKYSDVRPCLEKAGEFRSPSRVINIGSIDGIGVPALETYSYSASKAAVHHLTKVLAKKLAPKKITVNAVAPGPFQSRMMRVTLERAGDAINNMVPLGRIGSPDDMAGVAIFLASRAGAYLDATVIPVDGGISGTR